jgi:hypothetical protein
LGQQGVGALKLFLAQQQMIHSLGNLINDVGMGHGRKKYGLPIVEAEAKFDDSATAVCVK